MPYFQPIEQPKPYYCPNCKKFFIPSNFSCAVAHAPGDCCHYMETEVNDVIPEMGITPDGREDDGYGSDDE